jgi:hypothetical protein
MEMITRFDVIQTQANKDTNYNFMVFDSSFLNVQTILSAVVKFFTFKHVNRSVKEPDINLFDVETIFNFAGRLFLPMVNEKLSQIVGIPFSLDELNVGVEEKYFKIGLRPNMKLFSDQLKIYLNQETQKKRLKRRFKRHIR